MLRSIKLHGYLGEKYGESFALSVLTPGEAIHALCTQIPGLEQDIRKGEWICVRGDVDEGLDCDEILLRLRFGSITEFHIIPAAVGRKSGVGKILIGIALIAATVITAGMFFAGAAFLGGMGVGTAIGTFGVGGFLAAGAGGLGLYVAGIGALFILSGAAKLLAPHPSGGTETDERPGFLFDGAANTSQQGGVCPIVIGRILAGSVVVSAGITSERIGAAGTDYSPGSGTLIYNEMAVGNLA